MAAQFSVDVHPGYLLTLHGELDAATASDLRPALDRPGSLRLDCSDLTFIDSSGFKLLFEAYRRAEEHGDELVLCRRSGVPRRAAELVGLTAAFCDRHDEACARC